MKRLVCTYNLLDSDRLDLICDERLVGEIVWDSQRQVFWLELFGITNRCAQKSQENAVEAAYSLWE